MVSGESSVHGQRVAKDDVRELGKKAVFKDLIHEGGDFVVQYFNPTSSCLIFLRSLVCKFI